MHRASAAFRDAAAEFGAGEFEMLAYYPQQRRVGLGLDTDRLAVDREVNRRHAVPP